MILIIIIINTLNRLPPENNIIYFCLIFIKIFIRDAQDVMMFGNMVLVIVCFSLIKGLCKSRFKSKYEEVFAHLMKSEEGAEQVQTLQFFSLSA